MIIQESVENKEKQPTPWLTPAEAARHIGISPTQFLAYVRSGEITHYRISQKIVRFQVADLDSWIRSKKNKRQNAA